MKVSTIKITFNLLLFFLFSNSLFSQSLVERKLSYNPTLLNRQEKLSKNSNFRTSLIADTVALGVKGIIDDFSYDGPYPDTSLWLDNEVYINRGFGISPMSIGVATFDGLGADGYPYNFFASVASQPADTLTSKPIDLNYAPVDSIYLSFYYQPQGVGNNPQTDDSIVLEFKAPGNSPWEHIWSKEGSALAAGDTSFKLVMIPITNPTFLKKGFQFRFRNYASINANADQWNVDYIYLNTTRTFQDTIFSDVAWVYNSSPLLKNYTAMPWKHYTPVEIRTSVNNLIRNNDVVLRSLNYNYQSINVTTSAVLDQFNGSSNINPFLTNNVYTDCDVSLGCINSVSIDASKFPSSLTGPTRLGIKHYYSSNLLGDFIPTNDTLNVLGDFSNYFAYDDGTAESEAGLINALNGMIAVKFNLNVSDTLGALDIYFSPFITNAELYGFKLNVWNDNGGKPGTIIYTSSALFSPIYEKKGTNVFARYYIVTPMPLGAGSYYIGITQKTTESLNIGMDKNNNSQSNTFINLGAGGWQNSPIAGAIMMRPIMGNIVNPTSISTFTSPQHSLKLFPNPVSDKLYFIDEMLNNTENVRFQIIDVFGKIILDGNQPSSNYIDVSSLSGGVYFIRVISETEVLSNKFIKIN